MLLYSSFKRIILSNPEFRKKIDIKSYTRIVRSDPKNVALMHKTSFSCVKKTIITTNLRPYDSRTLYIKISAYIKNVRHIYIKTFVDALKSVCTRMIIIIPWSVFSYKI